jgi:hypothetical protein
MPARAAGKRFCCVHIVSMLTQITKPVNADLAAPGPAEYSPQQP